MAFTKKLSAESRGVCSGRDGFGQHSTFLIILTGHYSIRNQSGKNKRNIRGILINHLLLMSSGFDWHPSMKSVPERIIPIDWPWEPFEPGVPSACSSWLFAPRRINDDDL
jgi:hypothetical protein